MFLCYLYHILNNKPIIVVFENCGKLNWKKRNIYNVAAMSVHVYYFSVFTIFKFKKPIIVDFEIIEKLNELKEKSMLFYTTCFQAIFGNAFFTLIFVIHNTKL